MAVGKILRKVLRNFTFSISTGLVLLLLLNGFVYCPLVDGDTSAAPSPGDSSAGPCICNPPEAFCVHLSRKARLVIAFLIGVLGQLTATALFGSPYVDEEEEEEVAGAAKKAGYVAIRDDDVEAGGGGGGGKKY